MLAVGILVGGCMREIRLASHQEDVTKRIAAVLLVVLLAMAALRASTVGADTRNYQLFFQAIAKLPWQTLWDNDQLGSVAMNLQGLEIGYRYFCKVLSVISTNPQIITIAHSVLFVIPLGVFVFSESRDSWMSVLLFVALGIFQTCLNLTPSSIASLIVFCGMRSLREGRVLRFMLFVCIATIFHYSALIFFVLLVFNKIRLSPKAFLIGMVVAMLSPLFVSFVIPLIASLVPSYYKGYLASAQIMPEQLLVPVSQAIIFFTAYAGLKEKRTYCDQHSLYLWLFIFEFAAYGLSSSVSMFARVSLLFMPCLLVLVPNAICQQNEERDSLTDWKLRPMNIFSTSGFLVLLITAQYIARLFINNIGSTLPYATFW
jgi:hypothetical protein